MVRAVRYYGDPVLRKVAKPVSRFDEELKDLVKDMLETMVASNGVGLAAPQIGVSERVFTALELRPVEADERGEGENEGEVDFDALTPEEKRERLGVVAEHVMVNPRLIGAQGAQYGFDGCLSLPGLYVEKMRRAQVVQVSYQDLEGNPHELVAEGHFAHVIQHEMDHLDGILFFDRLPEDEKHAFMEAHRKELAEFQREAKALLKDLKREAVGAAKG